MPFNFRFGVIMRYAGRRLPRRAAGAVHQMLHPALDGEIGDGYPVAYLLLIGHRPSRRTGLDAEDAVDPGHRRPHCRPVFKGTHDQLGSPRRQRSGPGGERIPDQRPNPPAAVQQRPRHRAALLTGGAKTNTVCALFITVPLICSLFPGLSPAIVTLLILLQPAAGRPGKMPGEPLSMMACPHAIISRRETSACRGSPQNAEFHCGWANWIGECRRSPEKQA